MEDIDWGWHPVGAEAKLMCPETIGSHGNWLSLTELPRTAEHVVAYSCSNLRTFLESVAYYRHNDAGMEGTSPQEITQEMLTVDPPVVDPSWEFIGYTVTDFWLGTPQSHIWIQDESLPMTDCRLIAEFEAAHVIRENLDVVLPYECPHYVIGVYHVVE